MNVKKRPPFDPSDPSLQPTRKVESMSSIAAELLLKELDAAFDDRSEKRLRSDRPPALDAGAGADPTWQSQPWRMTATTTDASLALPAAPRPGAKTVVLLIAGALLLVAASVAVTLLVTR